MSPKETPPTAGGGTSRLAGAFTPARIAMIAVAVLTLVFIFENTREVTIRLLVPEVTMPLYVALLATAVLGAACGSYFAARRRK
ncbi:lipopolysaccharide assembly protein LapA domain-containing protein [Streptomyces sp. NPDC090298]|uniref:lipopolysaccharide assembly protein LapA domain-containing protein n=1 Tax=Streptomyces sp. NPDC090298 TaxID=3365959 RepID=UPI0037FE112C